LETGSSGPISDVNILETWAGIGSQLRLL
jgi:hypothetical protein